MMGKYGNGYRFEGNDATIEAARENMERGGKEEKERVVRNERNVEMPSRKTKSPEILFVLSTVFKELLYIYVA
jgi:hypothetical protein